MAQIIIDFPDAIAARVRDGLASYYGFARSALAGETKAAFIKRTVAAILKSHVRQVEQSAAADAAGTTAALKAESEIAIT